MRRTVYFGPEDADILEHIEEIRSFGDYVKTLIRADMERGKSGFAPGNELLAYLEMVYPGLRDCE